jgi:AsmA protein
MRRSSTVTTIFGSGSIDLRQEKPDLTLKQKTKNTGPVALRSSIYVRSSFAKSDVEVDKGRVAALVPGAIALSMVNPILALIPLIDADPGCNGFAAFRDKKTGPRTWT